MSLKTHKINRKLKRAFDLTLCLITLPFLLPVFILLAILIRLDSRGPAFYTHERIGRNGKTFHLYKFRTMAKDADQQLKKYLDENPQLKEEWENTHKLHRDPRVTKLGSFLRKTSLDELPQIFNIIGGKMSLVGPRPIVQDEIEKYGKYFQEYCDLDPGLTGVWQISGRSDTSYDRRVACDHFYANNWSLWLDIKIILKTIPVAFKGFGAY